MAAFAAAEQATLAAAHQTFIDWIDSFIDDVVSGRIRIKYRSIRPDSRVALWANAAVEAARALDASLAAVAFAAAALRRRPRPA